ncbi:hypothetical protein [Haloferula sp. A504]|uniref:hypothetical protein n=1 Tax=Haloferula sp. A504 TaxID=3373601 RepID=UPI0031CB4783|nr:hypothetical protein [Verrucomicrobiaceae bacterium E54]
MSRHGPMHDPFVSGMIFRLEGAIHDFDRESRNSGQAGPKDSEVKSALQKLDKKLAGKPPKKAGDGTVAALYVLLGEVSDGIRASGPSAADLRVALRGIVESLDTRREAAGHSRGYLDFLGPFIEQARGGSKE